MSIASRDLCDRCGERPVEYVMDPFGDVDELWSCSECWPALLEELEAVGLAVCDGSCSCG